MNTWRGSVEFEWNAIRTRITWAGSIDQKTPDCSLSSTIRNGDISLKTSLDDLLLARQLTVGLGIQHKLVSVHVDVSSALTLPALRAYSVSADFMPARQLNLGGRLRLTASGISVAAFRADADTSLADVAYETEWMARGERRTTYTIDVPAIGVGLTRFILVGNAGTSSQLSWHPVWKEGDDDAAGIETISASQPLPALAQPTLPTVMGSECSACGLANPSAASSDRTIGFGEVMVGDVAGGGLILNCPGNVFCWLAEITARPRSPFSVAYAPLGLTIPFGSERRLELEFAPTSSGEFRDSITIRYCFAYWVKREYDDTIGDYVDEVSGYWTYRCSLFTFPLAGIGLAKPEARATYSPDAPVSGKNVTFDGSGSFDPNPGGTIVAYHWDFGDGTTSALERPTHRFSGTGTYTVQLAVQNNREMWSDPYALEIKVSPDLVEAAAAVGAAAAAGWATHTLSMAAPVLAAAVPGAMLAVSSIISEMGLAKFPIDQLVMRFPESWDVQDVQGLIERNFPGAQVIGFFSTLQAFLVLFPLSMDSPEQAAIELNAIRERLAKVLPPGTQIGKNYVGQFEGSMQSTYSTTACDVESLDADFREAYEAVRAPEAWRRMAASDVRLKPVRIAVIDTGIAADHTEFVIPLRGRSYVVEEDGAQPWYEDDGGHGTQISGIIGAENGEGRMNGMLSSCAGYYEMQVYRVIGDMFSVWDCLRIAVSRAEEELDAWSTAVAASTRRKSVVLNISLGWDLEAFPDSERVLAKNTFLDLFDQYPDTLFVTSAGNGDQPENLTRSSGKEISRGSNVHAPGGLRATNNLTVAATDSTGTELMAWSNYGAAVDIAAPGNQVYTADNDGGYTWRVEGTSYAAAMVSGAAAAVLAIDPKLTPEEVKALLMSSPSRVRAPDGTLIPVLDFADAVAKAIESREARNRQTLWRAVGAGLGILTAGILFLRPF